MWRSNGADTEATLMRRRHEQNDRIILSIGLDTLDWKDYPMSGMIDDGPQ